MAVVEQTWITRTAHIDGEDGSVVFHQENVEVPAQWSQRATNIVAQKYFRGQQGTPQRETSVKQMIGRVINTIRDWGMQDGYFADEDEGTLFAHELTTLLESQRAAFNSPVFFNVGVEECPQASACFILSVHDSMESILEWVRQEGMIFKGGSGSGVNISELREANAHLSSGGRASGPLSFMRVADANAGAIKSGGKTRRAAKMVVLNVDHPDIMAFIQCKVREEEKAQALLHQGFSNGIEGEAYTTVAFQNANNSVRVTDAFMRAALNNQPWTLLSRNGGEPIITSAAKILSTMAEATWRSGDPGIHYGDTINQWHTCATTGPINSSNPCSEFMFLDDTACNLSSLNLLAYLNTDNTFQVNEFAHDVHTLITAMDILVDRASYPTQAITENSWRFRPLGLGYANLGATLMAMGLPYDSEYGREVAAAITALMTASAYHCSAELAQRKGPFQGYARNAASMQGVIKQHMNALPTTSHGTRAVADIWLGAQNMWVLAEFLGGEVGYRNAQATLLAPTGTIAFMMDCDTTGVEPLPALVQYKALVGGGSLTMVSTTVRRALQTLGYDVDECGYIEQYIAEAGTVEGCTVLKPEHVSVFACAFPMHAGGQSIHWEGHVRMVGAVQPFLSGSVSKTINLPEDCTVEDIQSAYVLGWLQGTKSLAIYRSGSKKAQPITVKAPGPDTQFVEALRAVRDDLITSQTITSAEAPRVIPIQSAAPHRRRLPDERPAISHKFNIAGYEGYLVVGLYDDGQPGELFITMAKQGSTISGLCDTIGILTSLLLQYGVPLDVLVTKLKDTRFEPAGFTTNEHLPLAKSIVDYVFRWLAQHYINTDTLLTVARVSETMPAPVQTDAPTCPECGTLMLSRNGTCFGCLNCGCTSGCS